MAERLADAGVTVHVFEDKTLSTPDSVLSNNWFSTHSGGLSDRRDLDEAKAYLAAWLAKWALRMTSVMTANLAEL